jgi:hypothetical protein
LFKIFLNYNVIIEDKSTLVPLLIEANNAIGIKFEIKTPSSFNIF